jgi:hypothetical protein
MRPSQDLGYKWIVPNLKAEYKKERSAKDKNNKHYARIEECGEYVSQVHVSSVDRTKY